MNNRRFHRVITFDINLVLDKIKEFENKDHRYKTNIDGFRVNVSSNRLKTFIHSQSCPCCKLKASFFALEKQERKYHMNPDSKKGYHLNLYGILDNEEILFTHDHTLARGLGGEDKLFNTVTMCSPCNAHKGQLESRIKITKSEKYRTLLEEEIQKFLSTGIKNTPEHPEPELDKKPDSVSYLKKLEIKEIKRLYKKQAKTPELLTEEEKNKLLNKELLKKEIYEQYPQSSRRRKP